MSEFRRKLMMAYAANLGRGDIVYPGLIAAWSAKGKSNDDEDRATLRDLTGNGHNITLNGFAFSEMSGYGGYKLNFTDTSKFGFWLDRNKYTYSNNKVIITEINSANTFFARRFKTTDSSQDEWKVKIFGISNTTRKLRIVSSIKGLTNFSITVNTDGIYTIPKVEGSLDNNSYSAMFLFNVGDISTTEECNITIELLPEYPDALVFDGVDDYGVNKGMPILTDYTIIVKRYIYDDNVYQTATIDKRPAFIFEPQDRRFTSSFGTPTYNLKASDINGVIFQSKNNFNGQRINSGDSIDTNQLLIGKMNIFYRGMAFYSAYLFDRSLDEQEIKSFIRQYIDPEYLLPSEIPTPDCYYDFSQGSNDDETRDTIKDLSGNGNDAVAHNFAWRGMSGYGGYDYYIKLPYDNRFNYDKIGDNKFIFHNILINGTYIFYYQESEYTPGGKLKFKITNIPTFDGKFYIMLNNITILLDNIKQDGEYEVDIPKDAIGGIAIRFEGLGINSDIEGLTFEFIPNYPGALVFDGVDDYVSLDAFDSGFKTMFMVCKPFRDGTMFYDQRLTTNINDYALYNIINDIAYKARNINDTYINGVLNTKILANGLINKKHLITINSQLTELSSPLIGVANSKIALFANMAVYKFLGFKEALTEEQINAIIKKYNLLDGVDEIEVS